MAELRGFIEISLTESRASAAFAAGRQIHLKPGGLENFHGGDTDLRIMITHKRIVPENDPAARRLLRARMTPEPFVETLPGVAGQRSLPGEAEGLREQTAHQQGIHGHIRNPRHPARDFANLIQGAEDSLEERETVALDLRV